jgi:hypothetical protein
MSKFFNVMLCEMFTDITQEPTACVTRLGTLVMMMGQSWLLWNIYQTTRHHIPEDS